MNSHSKKYIESDPASENNKIRKSKRLSNELFPNPEIKDHYPPKSQRKRPILRKILFARTRACLRYFGWRNASNIKHSWAYATGTTCLLTTPTVYVFVVLVLFEIASFHASTQAAFNYYTPLIYLPLTHVSIKCRSPPVLFRGHRFVCWILSLCLKQWGLMNYKKRTDTMPKYGKLKKSENNEYVLDFIIFKKIWATE